MYRNAESPVTSKKEERFLFIKKGILINILLVEGALIFTGIFQTYYALAQQANKEFSNLESQIHQQIPGKILAIEDWTNKPITTFFGNGDYTLYMDHNRAYDITTDNNGDLLHHEKLSSPSIKRR
jgi:hypothetical protein